MGWGEWRGREALRGDQESPSEMANAGWLATAHSPCPLPSHVKVQMSLLTPSKLSLLCFYLSGFYHSHFTTGESHSICVCGWQVQSRDKGREEPTSSGGGGLSFLPPAVPPLSPVSTTRYPTSPHAFRALPGPLEAHTSTCPQGRLLARPLALPCCLACVALGRSCPVSSATFPHGPCLPLPIPGTSLDFPQHYSHICGPHLKRASTDTCGLTDWFSQPGHQSLPGQSGSSFERLPQPPTPRRPRPDSRQQLLPLRAVVLVS